jgi:uncharacterized membrane protein
MLFLLFVFFLCSSLESRQSQVPKIGKVIAEQRDALRVQFINTAGTCAAITHQAGLLQYPQVL